MLVVQKKTERSDETTGEVVVFNPENDKRKFFDSDTVSCLANLTLLSAEQRGNIYNHLLFSKDEASTANPDNELGYVHAWIDLFNRDEDVQRLAHLVSIERPGFVSRIDPRHLANVFAVVPKKSNMRIAAQDGEFLVFGLNFPNEQYFFVSNIELQEVYISGSKKHQIRKELAKIMISEERLFPEIETAAKHLAKRYKFESN